MKIKRKISKLISTLLIIIGFITITVGFALGSTMNMDLFVVKNWIIVSGLILIEIGLFIIVSRLSNELIEDKYRGGFYNPKNK